MSVYLNAPPHAHTPPADDEDGDDADDADDGEGRTRMRTSMGRMMHASDSIIDTGGHTYSNTLLLHILPTMAKRTATANMTEMWSGVRGR